MALEIQGSYAECLGIYMARDKNTPENGSNIGRICHRAQFLRDQSLLLVTALPYASSNTGGIHPSQGL